MIQKQGYWVPYELKLRDVERHFVTCELLLQRQKMKIFLHRIVTGDEKWLHYENTKCRKSWGKPGHASTSFAKPNNHGSKLLLCIWWDQQGVIYYELFKTNETITGDRYWLPLMRLSRSLNEKRPLYAPRRHTTKWFYYMTTLGLMLQKQWKTSWKHFNEKYYPHPSYSPEITPSDFHLFRSMAHGLADQHFFLRRS